jgi:tripartite-type tricarboxylate transporter receptor subunit TctC
LVNPGVRATAPALERTGVIKIIGGVETVRHPTFKSAYAGAALLAALGCATLAPAAAEDYPGHPISLIVPYPAGGGVDTVGRVVAQKLTEALNQQVLVVNRPGAGSVFGVRDGAKATPDGYTLLMLVTGASLPPDTGYDLAKDFAPVGLIASIPIVIMANPSVPAKSLAEVVALAKKQPGTITIGTPPSPTLNYFGAEQFKSMTGTDVTIVTYKGTGPLTNDLLGGHVMLAFNTLPPAIGNIQAGKLRAIAVASPQRLSAIPDVPTTAEAGMPALDIVQYYGLVAPAGTPRPIVDRLNKELRAIVSSADFDKRIVAAGGSPVASSPEEYAGNIQREESKWAALIKKLGLKVGN